MLKVGERYVEEKLAKNSKNWCWENYLKERSLESAWNVKKQLCRVMTRLNMQVSNSPNKKDDTVSTALRKALCGAFFQNICYLQGKGYVTLRDKQAVDVHPGSTLEHKPEWVVYNDAVRLGSTRVRIYRIEAKLPGDRAVTVLVSRVGEILQVDFPGQLQITNENIPLREGGGK